jgi:hypothetical protein
MATPANQLLLQRRRESRRVVDAKGSMCLLQQALR